MDAYHGEGDAAPDASQTRNLKPVQIFDRAGRRRGVRPVFVPQPWTYAAAFEVLEQDQTTDAALERAVDAHRKGPLPFET